MRRKGEVISVKFKESKVLCQRVNVCVQQLPGKKAR